MQTAKDDVFGYNKAKHTHTRKRFLTQKESIIKTVKMRKLHRLKLSFEKSSKKRKKKCIQVLIIFNINPNSLILCPDLPILSRVLGDPFRYSTKITEKADREKERA